MEVEATPPSWASLCLESEGATAAVTASDAPAETSLRDRARAYIAALPDSESRSIALSELVSSLEPVLGSIQRKVLPRRRALKILGGAIHGCYHSDEDDGSASASSLGRGLNHKVSDFVGKFLISHCRPFEMDSSPMDQDGDEDDDTIVETIRDAAAEAVAALGRCPIDPGDLPANRGNTAGTFVGEYVASIKRRMLLARQGVEARCLSDEFLGYEQQFNHGFEDEGGNNTMEGLATLPRARRSLCFTILEEATEGSSTDLALLLASLPHASRHYNDASILSVVSSLRNDTSSFVSFVSTCLHGETDPRCLLQMLRLLHQCQNAFLILFDDEQNNAGLKNRGDDMDIDASANIDDAVTFPSVALFDSVAPYYPIKFTPPPNDPHGITRHDLQRALMDVLQTDRRGSTNRTQDTMAAFATRLFLERLVPPASSDPYATEDDIDGPECTSDKIEALTDLKELLLPQDKEIVDKITLPLTMINTDVAKELSSALVKVNHDAVMDLSTASNKKDTQQYTALLDACRDVSAALARALEGTVDGSSHASLWVVFVAEKVRELAPALSTSPQGGVGRSSTAYLASMCAGGGVRTLRACLDECLPRLIDVITEYTGQPQMANDVEKTAAAIIAVGTLFSSSERTLTLARGAGVSLHPHPLKEYASQVICSLKDLIRDISLKDVAAKCLGPVLFSTPSAILSEAEIKSIHQEIVYLAAQIVCTDGGSRDISQLPSMKTSDWANSFSLVVGCAIGRALASNFKENPNQECISCVLDDNHDTVVLITDQILVAVMRSAMVSCSVPNGKSGHMSNDGGAIVRYDWKTLASSCRVGGILASRIIVTELLSTTLQNLGEITASYSELNYQRAIASSLALSYVLRKGGDSPATVYHEVSSPHGTALDLIHELGRCSTVHKLYLSHDMEKKANESVQEINLANAILPNILPAYRKALVPDNQFDQYIALTSERLHSFSNEDSIQLSVIIPVIADMLANVKRIAKANELESSTLERMANIVPPLLDYCASCDQQLKARSAAASCIFLVVLYYQEDGMKSLSTTILSEYLFPSTYSTLEKYKSTMTRSYPVEEQSEAAKSSPLDSVQNSLELLAAVGASAACRGGTSAHDADAVTRFLIQLACDRSSSIPLTSESVSVPLDEINLAAASSFGSILSVQGGGPFWRQRMVHIALPYILSYKKDSFTRQSTATGARLGSLVSACHVICCSSIVAIGSEHAKEVVDMVARGFVELADVEESSTIGAWSDLVSGILSSILKLLYSSPDYISPYIAILIPKFLEICKSPWGKGSVPCLLLSLQCLIAATHFPPGKGICKSKKMKVLAGIVALADHPSTIIRHAAVDTANTWSVLT